MASDIGGHVYFIEASGSPYVKIGWTEGEPEDRCAKLQVGCPLELTVIAEYPGCREDERRAHRRLAHAHVRGEWFDRTADGVEEVIARGLHALPSALPDEAERIARDLAYRRRGRGWRGCTLSSIYARECLAAIDEWEDALLRAGEDDLSAPRALRADLLA